MSGLNAGKGLCRATASLLIKPVRAVIELGAAEDVRRKTLLSVHHTNRQGSPEDMIAVAFPCMKMGRNAMLPGDEIVLLGSEAALAVFENRGAVEELRRRGMLEQTEIEGMAFDPGETGAAYVRDRACEKHTPGWVRRSEARAARRGKPLGQKVTPRGNDKTALTLRYTDAVLHVREVVGVFSGEPLQVSTYGFSAPSSPSILPVFPESERERDDAA